MCYSFAIRLQDAVFQYARRNGANTFKLRQVVPALKWELVPSPVVEVRQQQHHHRFRPAVTPAAAAM